MEIEFRTPGQSKSIRRRLIELGFIRSDVPFVDWDDVVHAVLDELEFRRPKPQEGA